MEEGATEQGPLHQATDSPASTIDIVSRIQRVETSLSPAERRVAEAVRQDFEAATRLTIAELARRAGVSQPTVTRFCRSVGSRSFGEFKIQLATTLTVAAAYLNSDRVFGDDAGQLAHAVMMNAANAIREGLDQLDTAALTTAIAALAASRRIDIYGQGSGSAAIAEDARLRLFRLSIPVAAYCDGHQQRMSAATLGPGDTVLAISNSGRTKPVIEAVEIARSFGAAAIALTRPATPLAAAADIVIAVTVPEVGDILRPSPSRYAHMAIVDTLATGVAASLGARARESLRRVRYTLARLGVAIPAPSTDPTQIMRDLDLRE
ncbi:MAG: MurR/RpiR family transcriptional regulator [Bauldia sp.]|uniref:MurR/RpiR family transcriptional regulator n=1 Tax=Bauldia sp. TaxID=2575872 RepID=UPI001D3A066E|nr:MurR/RpiR family transcriptional regulator [Bauldia sp.]MCB1487306.1 MurR/RpiR family transcriptional regulator [Bauldia sp.]MCB1495817.1 MurR/RpiR family transcriptional regulator [Bauldia sp.]